MQINIDQYIRNFRIFYQQLARGHSKQQHLNKQFKLLIESQLKKWKKSYGISKISETQSDNPLLNKIRENRKNKQQIKINIEVQFTSQKVENCIVYGYLYLIFEYKNVQAFEYLQELLKEPLSNKDAYSPPTLRKMNFVWSKLADIINGKRKMVRFDKQLQEYSKELPQPLIDLIYHIIIQDKIFIPENRPLYFEEMSKFLGLKIEYFEVNEQQAIKNFTYGEESKTSIKLGYLKQDNTFVNVAKLPQKQEKQLNKEATLQKFGQISTHLNEMYSLNMKQYLNLSNLKNRLQSNRLADSRSSQLKDSRNQSQSNINTSQFGAI